MTANINILAHQRENVIIVPQRAITRKDNATFVRVLLDDESVVEQRVTVGLRSSDESVEIVSGLAEGDTVITFSNGE